MIRPSSSFVIVPIRLHFFFFVLISFASTRSSCCVSAKLQENRNKNEASTAAKNKVRVGTEITMDLEEEGSSSSSLSSSEYSSSSTPPLTKIINGKDAHRNQYPWFIRLLRKEDKYVTCGAVLIGPDVAMTAAHCNYPSAMLVGVRAYVKGGDTQEIFRTITRRIVHPKFNKKTLEHDIMIIELSEAVPDVTPIKIVEDQNVPNTGELVTAIGLGSTSDKEMKIPDVLQHIEIEVYNNKFCNKKQSYRGAVKEETMFCAGFEDAGQHQDACFGDSGGPLVNSKGELCGLISFGVGCGDENFPGVYAKVAPFFDWIEDVACSITKSESGGHLSCHTTPDPDPPNIVGANASSRPAKSSDDRRSSGPRRYKKKRRERNASGRRNEPSSRPRVDGDSVDCTNSPNTQVKYSTTPNSGAVRNHYVTTTCKDVGNRTEICGKPDVNNRGRISIWEVCSRECTSYSRCSK
mmetsp:Transcript_2554/g.3572  ORF Transcript_2554/g.3572 Transcript_2554/m.3572 type:complete len:464 (+) Transcript_2554:375-1766(+)